MIKEAIENWVHDPEHHDQEAEGKNTFLQSGKYEKTRLHAVGIANPTLKKAASEMFRTYKKEDFGTILSGIDEIMKTSNVLEEQILAIYLLEKFKKQFDRTTFDTIATWIDHIDYWAISDHLAINLFGYFPLEKESYQKELRAWLEGENYWRRRQGLTAYLKRAREHAELVNPVLETVSVLLGEDNYYIQKAIPWIMRESYRKHPQNHDQIFEFIQEHMANFSKTQLREVMKYLESSRQDKLLEQYESLNG